MKIILLPKKELYPSFARANLSKKIIYIREDMVNTTTYKFLLCHEKYHLKDMPKNRLWGEVKANIYAGIRHPIGFLIILFKSIFNLDRLKLYLKLFK